MNNVEEARRTPVIGTMGSDAAAGGGIRLVEPRRIQAAHQLLQGVIKLFGRISFIARAPERDGWMVTVTQNFIGDVGKIGGNIAHVGTVKRVGLEELIPQ